MSDHVVIPLYCVTWAGYREAGYRCSEFFLRRQEAEQKAAEKNAEAKIIYDQETAAVAEARAQDAAEFDVLAANGLGRAGSRPDVPAYLAGRAARYRPTYEVSEEAEAALPADLAPAVIAALGIPDPTIST